MIAILTFYLRSVLGKFPFLILLIPIISGVLLEDKCFQSKSDTNYWILLLIATTVLAIIHLRKHRYQLLKIISICFPILIIGGLITQISNVKNQTRWFGNHIAKTSNLIIQVKEVPIEKEKTYLLQTQVIGIQQFGSDSIIPTKGKLPVYIFKKNYQENIKIGDILLIPNSISLIKNNNNPFAFNYEQYANRQGIYYQGFFNIDKIIFLGNLKDEHHLGFLDNAKLFINNSLVKCIPESTTQNLVLATILNHRTNLSDDLWNAFSNTGIVHIIAISGMHVNLLFSLLLYCLYFIKSKKYETVKYLIAIPLIWAYVTITGFPPSAVRAAVMFTFVALGMVLHRKAALYNILCLAAFFMLLYNPMYLYDVGVQLSFLAVLSIYIFYKPISNLFVFKNKYIHLLWQSIALSIGVQILVAPLVIYYFHMFPIWSVFANIFAGLYSTILMFGAVIIIILCAIRCSIIGMWIGKLLTFLTLIFTKFIDILNSYSITWLQNLYIDAIQYWVIMLAIILGCIALFTKEKIYLIACVLVCSYFTIDIILTNNDKSQQERLIVYSSPSGNITVINGKKAYTYLSDTLTSKDYNNNIKNSLLAYGVQKSDQQLMSDKTFIIDAQKVIILRDTYQLQDTVDYVIISNQHASELDYDNISRYSKHIILDGSINRFKALKLQGLFTNPNIHIVSTMGAFVLSKKG